MAASTSKSPSPSVMASPTIRPDLPRLDTNMSRPSDQPAPLRPRPAPDQLVEERLISAVACVLRLPREDITLIDSFADLGGNEQTAHALRSICMAAGLELHITDIMRCQTLAELQTCVRPSSPPDAPDRADTDDDSSVPSAVFTSDSAHRHSSAEDLQVRNAGSPPKSPPNVPAEREALESLILSTPQVADVAIIRPKAGLLEDKTVAFISLHGDGEGAQYGLAGVHVIAQSQVHDAGSRIATIRLALESAGHRLTMPSNWIILDQLPLIAEGGAVDRRKLQTWAQNMNQEMYEKVTSIETDDLYQEPLNDVERIIQRAASRALRVPERQVGMNFSFSQLGGDEVSAMLLVAACKTQGVAVRPEDVLQSPSLSQVASLASSQRTDVERIWGDDAAENLKLSPMQQLYFDTATGGREDARAAMDGSYRFNKSILLRITTAATLEEVHAAMQAIVSHHAMLRARFCEGPEGWTQRIIPEADGAYGFGYQTVDDHEAVLRVMEQAQTRIDVENGPVFAVEHFKTTDGQQMLFMVAHHLVMDSLSWRIIVHDLDELLRKGTLFSHRSMPFWAWNELQEKELERTAEASPLPFTLVPCEMDSWGLGNSLNTYGESAEVHFTINPELTAILHSTCTQVLNTDIAEIYVAALHLAFAQTFPERTPPTIWNKDHGREPWNVDIDITETVGWLNSLCPMGMRFGPSNDLLQVLRDIKDTRRSLAHHGWKYFASRFFGPYAPTRCAEGWPFEIMFDFLGARKQILRENGALELVDVPEQTLTSSSSDYGHEVSRMALFEVNVTIDNGAARIGFVYNRLSNQQDRIADWIHHYEHLLYEAIGKLRYQSPELTLADVPLLDTDYSRLAKLNTDGFRDLGLTSAWDVEDIMPATATQQDILVGQIQRPDSGQLFSIHELTLENGTSADQSHICAAWEHIVAKYPALRTIFIDSIRKEGLYDQLILRRCSPEMLFFDAEPGDDAVTSLRSLPARSTLPSLPRHRLTVCTSLAGAFLKLEASQALFDLPSLQVLMAELKRAYNSAKMPMNVLDPPHVVCQQYLASARRDDSLAFWQGRLEDTPPCRFPSLRGSHDGDELHETHFDLDVTAADADDFCRKYAVDRGTLVRVAWGLVLRAFTDSNRVCFGYRTSGRDAAGAPSGIEQAVGSFETTVPCHMDFWAYQSVEAIVRDAEDDWNYCRPHQHVLPSEVNEALGMKGEQFFNTSVHYVEGPPVLKSRFCSSRPQMELTAMQSFGTLDNDVSLLAMFVHGRLACGISHRILSRTQAWSVVSAFGEALKAIVRNPFASVGGLDLSGRDNRALLGPSRHELLEPCVHSLFSNQARSTPEAAAVCAGDGDFSYKTLARLVQRLASHLGQWGVKPGVAVPVVLGRTKWSIVSILAVLKAGGCFVPVDGEDRFMVESVIKDINPQVILVTENVSPTLNLFVDGVIFVNEALFSTQFVADAPPRKASGDDAACVLFPAGSSRTREIRGYTYSHNALSSAFLAQGKALSITHETRLFQISSFSVDTCLVEVLATLVHGGCVCMPTPDERRKDVVGAIRRTKANWLYLTPILARRLQPSALPTVKVACFRTRGLDEDTCAPWLRRTRVILVYGCLEIAPLGIAALEVTRNEDLTRIAKPFLGQAWIANSEDPSKLVPVGAVGELCIESATIAHRFVPGEPLRSSEQLAAQQAGDGAKKMVRYVKTSQRVRQADDDVMDLILDSSQDMTFEGRVIPASHVEMHLRRCLGAGIDVAVESITTRDGKPFLACFTQLDKAWKGPDDLSYLDDTMRQRAYFASHFAQTSLQKSLPAYMIPSIYIPIRQLPVTSAMKVNRRRLQKWMKAIPAKQLYAIADTPQTDKTAEKARFKPLPLTQVEECMRAVWAVVLKIDEAKIDPNQDFFAQGGGNASAARLVVQCRQQGLDIAIADVLRRQSLTELCQGITIEADAKSQASPAMPDEPAFNASATVAVDHNIINTVVAPQLDVKPKQIKEISEASASQVRSIEVGTMKERGDVSYLVFNLIGLESVSKLEAACFGMCVVHPILRTTFARQGTKVWQVAVQSRNPEFKRIHCPTWRLSALTDKVIKKDENESNLFFNAMPTKFFYLDAGKQSTLIMRLSKAQYDDISVPLLVQDLTRFYAGSHSPRRSTYYDLVRSAEVAHANGGSEHWRKLLDGAEMTQVIRWSAPPSLSPTLKVITRETAVHPLTSLGISFDTVVKAAWAIVLANISGSGDILFGEVVDGRHVRLLDGGSPSGIIGPVQNTIPVRVRFGDAPCTPMDLLQDLHSQKSLASGLENAGWLDMCRASSSKLPAWSRFSTAVHHNPHKNDLSHVKFGEAACKLTIREAPAKDAYDLLVTTSNPQQDKATVSLTFCEDRVPLSFAEETLDSLRSTLELLTSVSLMQPLIPPATEFRDMSRRIPFPEPRADPAPTGSGALPPVHQFALQPLIAAAWTRAVCARDSDSNAHEAAFYDLCGTLLPAAEIASHITRELPNSGVPGAEAVEITMEDVIAHPTMRAQLDLIVRRLRDDTTGPKKKLSSAFAPRTPASLGRSIRRLASTTRGHARAGSDGTHQYHPGPAPITARDLQGGRSSLDGGLRALAEEPVEMPAAEANVIPPIPEMDGEEISRCVAQAGLAHESPPSADEQPRTVLMAHEEVPRRARSSGSSNEGEDVVMPLGGAPASRFSPDSSEDSYVVSPMTPARGAGAFQPAVVGLGIEQGRPASVRGQTGMKKRASSLFGKIGLAGQNGTPSINTTGSFV